MYLAGRGENAFLRVLAPQLSLSCALNGACARPCFPAAVTRREYQLVDVSADGFASLLDASSGETLDSLQIPPAEWKDDPEERVRPQPLAEHA